MQNINLLLLFSLKRGEPRERVRHSIFYMFEYVYVKRLGIAFTVRIMAATMKKRNESKKEEWKEQERGGKGWERKGLTPVQLFRY